MATPIPINASKARSEFFKILEDVFSNDESYLIKKGGISIAKITKPEKKDDFDIMDLAGAWKELNIDSDSMIKYIYEGRSDKKEIKRKLPKLK